MTTEDTAPETEPRPEGAQGVEAGEIGHPDGETHGPGQGSLTALTLGAIGVVYGDIGTSPIYAMRETLRTVSAGGLLPEEVIGLCSMLIWTLFIIVGLKYVTLLLRADNQGEGDALSYCYR